MEETTAALDAAANNGGNWAFIGVLVVMVVVFYFFMYRPQKKQEKEKQKMQNNYPQIYFHIHLSLH